MRRTRPDLGMILLAWAVAALACGVPAAPATPAQATGAATESIAVPHGNRLLGIDVSEAAGEGFDRAFSVAREAGLQFTSLSLAWDDLEPRPGEFSADPNFLAIANQYYPAQDVPLALTIAPIDTNRDRRPADLAGRPFDDPEVIARFERLLDDVFSQVSDLQLVVLAIGNEVDATLGSDAGAWARYQAFYESAAAHARQLRPGLPVGVKMTMEALTGAGRELAQSLNASSDMILVTYYPLRPDFGVRPADEVAGDLSALASLYPDRPIGILEAGYPSSTTLASSEAQQAEFVRQLFRAWDAQGERIALLNFTWLTDAPPATIEAWTDYYGLDGPRFAAYLATLGLRHADGEPKPAFEMLADEAHARGW